MERPDLIFVTGCNAAGKTSLIRSHLSEFPDYEIIMTDVYKGRSREVFREAVRTNQNILLETPFNDEGFRDLIDLAKLAHYQSSLVVLFLKSPAQSIERVANRTVLENGLHISSGNVEHNFMENLKNVAKYFLYFDESHFYYTGERGHNRLIMRYEKDKLAEYVKNDFAYVQHFANLAYRFERLATEDKNIIVANKDYRVGVRNSPVGKGHKLH
ncbi:MAG TPA: hypothetical protein VKQ52_20530 [Puia sp.]|nr:hypothetical protein [Puia sp.]